MAEREGFSRIVFRPFAAVRDPLPSLSESASSPAAGLSLVFSRLPAVADFDDAMSLEMSLAAKASELFWSQVSWRGLSSVFRTLTGVETFR